MDSQEDVILDFCRQDLVHESIVIHWQQLQMLQLSYGGITIA